MSRPSNPFPMGSVSHWRFSCGTELWQASRKRTVLERTALGSHALRELVDALLQGIHETRIPMLHEVVQFSHVGDQVVQLAVVARPVDERVARRANRPEAVSRPRLVAFVGLRLAARSALHERALAP